MNTVTHIFEGRIAFLEGKLAIKIKILRLWIVFDPIIVMFLGIRSNKLGYDSDYSCKVVLYTTV